MVAIAQTRPGQLSEEQIARIRSRQAAKAKWPAAASPEPTLAGGWARVWTGISLSAVSDPLCRQCGGSGRLTPGRHWRPCGCALRSICREVIEVFRELRAVFPLSGVSYESGYTFGHPREEFMADLWRIAKRTLDAIEWQIFQGHLLSGAGWRCCAARVGMDRGNFFHAVYRIEERLGRTFVECGLGFPTFRYFGRHYLPALLAMGKRNRGAV